MRPGNLDLIVPMIHNHQGAKSNFLTSRLAPSQQEKLLSLDFQMPMAVIMSSRAAAKEQRTAAVAKSNINKQTAIQHNISIGNDNNDRVGQEE